MRKNIIPAIVALGSLLVPVTSSWAQSPTNFLTATDPQGIGNAMEMAGYDVEITTDDLGDPKIRTSFSGLNASIYFYGCDEESKDGCDSVQLQVGLDRKEPMEPTMALELMKKYRFASISLDESGDPWITHDIVMVKGISQTDFLRSLLLFSTSIEDISDQVFAAERAADAKATEETTEAS